MGAGSYKFIGTKQKPPPLLRGVTKDVFLFRRVTTPSHLHQVLGMNPSPELWKCKASSLPLLHSPQRKSPASVRMIFFFFSNQIENFLSLWGFPGLLLDGKVTLYLQ